MRAFVAGLMVGVAAGVVGGCSGPPAASAGRAAAAEQAAGTKACIMQAGGADVLRLAVPTGAKCVATDGSLHLDGLPAEVDVWLARGATTVDEGATRAGGQIVSQFRDFKADRTTDLTVAGSPAKRMVGSGHEADDGDDGRADVIVFAVGGRVFVACYHGERMEPASEQAMLAVVQTARVP